MFSPSTVACLFMLASSVYGDVNISQIHLSLSGDDSLMGLEYVSQDNSSSLVVEFKTLEDLVSKGRSKAQVTFRENIGFLHRVMLDGLTPSAKYHYRVGDGEDSWSEWYPFQSPPYLRDDFGRVGDDSTKGEGVGCVFADLGISNGLSTERIKTEGARGTYDYMVHVGDIAYDLFSDESRVGNQYMDLMMSATARYPLNVAEGNHEKGDNFTEYNLRFKSIEDLAGRVSDSHSNHYYSYDVGLIHYVVVSTEVYSYPTMAAAGPSPYTAAQQLQWLEEDLKRVNADGQREKTPWVVLLGHRPWYTALNGWAQIDDLACKYGVDLYITGHVHNYQRWAPMRVSAVGKRIPAAEDHDLPGRMTNPVPSAVDAECVSEDKHTYLNPKYMPVIVAGSTGCHSPAPRSACAAMYAGSKVALKDSLVDCTAAYGFGHLQAVNSTHLYWELVQSHRAPSADHSVLDEYLNATGRADILEAYGDVLQEQGVSPDAFMAEVQAQGERWVKSEQRRDAAVLEAGEEEDLLLGGAKESFSGRVSGGRLVRDHMWIVQESHGVREHC
jgi:acid phosphatase type 7